MKLKPQTAILIVLLLFTLGISITAATGIWSTKTQKVPAKLEDSQHAGENDPADIRGSYTFADVSNLYDIPENDIATAFALSQNDLSSFKCKDLESLYENSPNEVGTGSVRLFTAYYLGLPYTPSEETYLPASAAVVLMEQGIMSQEQISYLKAHTLPPQ